MNQSQNSEISVPNSGATSNNSSDRLFFDRTDNNDLDTFNQIASQASSRNDGDDDQADDELLQKQLAMLNKDTYALNMIEKLSILTMAVPSGIIPEYKRTELDWRKVDKGNEVNAKALKAMIEDEILKPQAEVNADKKSSGKTEKPQIKASQEQTENAQKTGFGSKQQPPNAQTENSQNEIERTRKSTRVPIPRIQNPKQETQMKRALPPSLNVPRQTRIVNKPAPNSNSDMQKLAEDMFAHAPNWWAQIRPVVFGNRESKGVFETQFLSLFKNEGLPCPLCKKQCKSHEFLKHFELHSRQTTPDSKLTYSLASSSRTPQKFNCFIKGCGQHFYDSDCKLDFKDQMRLHLSEHDSQDLWLYGMDPVLLKQDCILASKEGELKQCADLAEIMDLDRDELVQKCLGGKEKRIYAAMKQHMFNLFQDDNAPLATKIQMSESLPNQFESNSVAEIGKQSPTFAGDAAENVLEMPALLAAEESVLQSEHASDANADVDSSKTQQHVSEKLLDGGFDLDAAFKSVSQQTGSRLYKPWMFHSHHKKCLPSVYTSPLQEKTDDAGDLWLKVDNKHSLNEINTVEFQFSHQEDQLARQLLIQEKIRDADAYPAILALKSQGWKQPDSLSYIWVSERHAGGLLDYLHYKNQVSPINSSNMLLTARILSSVLVTADNLQKKLGLAIADLNIANLGLKSGYCTGFMKTFNLQNIGVKCTTSGYPYYHKEHEHQIEQSDAYLAALVAFTKQVVPVQWENLKKEQLKKPQDSRQHPYDFLKNLTQKCEWVDPDACKIQDELKGALFQGKEHLYTRKGRSTIKLFFSIFESTDFYLDTNGLMKQTYPDDHAIKERADYKLSQSSADPDTAEQELVAKPKKRKGQLLDEPAFANKRVKSQDYSQND